jgi:hypothetical protein
MAVPLVVLKTLSARADGPMVSAASKMAVRVMVGLTTSADNLLEKSIWMPSYQASYIAQRPIKTQGK